jgi:bifunctional DNase/RNase
LDVLGVRVEMPTNQPIVLLRERDGDRYLPIWIGAAEATAIAYAQQGVVPPRPLTHDLLRNVIDAEIVAEEALLDEAGVEMAQTEDDEVEKFKAFLDHVSADDFDTEAES